jgi:predicted component of type VI protein secretion system
LIVNDGRHERELLLVGTIVVGRDPACDISEDDDSLLSRRHTEFVAGPDGVLVRDLGSRNGTFVNGVRIAEGSIRAGDVVHVGRLRVRYVEDDAPAASERQPAAQAPPAAGDDEVTRIVHGARFAPGESVPSSPAAAEAARVPLDDDQKTVVTPLPRGIQPSRPAPAPAVDDERTVFITSGSPARAASRDVVASPVAQPPRTPGAAASVAAAAETLQSFVLLRTAAVAAVVFVAAVGAVAMGRAELFSGTAGAGTVFTWLVPPAAVALVAAYVASRQINARIGRIMSADKEDGPEV